MNIDEPDEVSIFRLWFLSFIKQLKSVLIEKINDEFENIRILLKSFGANKTFRKTWFGKHGFQLD